MQEATISFEDVKKTLLPVFNVLSSNRNKYLFPVYGKDKNWYFVFLNPHDAVWIMDGEQVSFMKRRSDFYHRFLNGSIKEISFSEFDVVATALFKRIYNHIQDSDEIYYKWLILSSNYYFHNPKNNTELTISEGFISFSKIIDSNQKSDLSFKPLNQQPDIVSAVKDLTEIMAFFYRLFAPSQLGYKDYLNNVKQVPREKNHAKTP